MCGSQPGPTFATSLIKMIPHLMPSKTRVVRALNVAFVIAMR